MEMSLFNEAPQDFINARKDVRENPEQFSSREYLEYLENYPSLSESTIARVKVDFHHRLAMPWTCFIVALLGIPFGAQTGRRGAFLGVLLTLGLFFGFYILINLGLAFGKKQLLVPWLAAWGPNLLFLLIGAVLIHRMR
jgi:lipopolysaccharide export LptBFGC system permease protein LptF